MLKRGFTVTGPGVERRCPYGSGAALSVAITFACAAARAKEEATFYVRDTKGESVGYAATDEDGVVTVRRFGERDDG